MHGPQKGLLHRTAVELAEDHQAETARLEAVPDGANVADGSHAGCLSPASHKRSVNAAGGALMHVRACGPVADALALTLLAESRFFRGGTKMSRGSLP